MNNFKNTLNITSGVAGAIITLTFGFWLLGQSDHQNLNLASWVMWALLDGVVVALEFKSGNKKPYLFIGWTIAATLVAVSMVWSGIPWHIGFAEVVSIAAVVVVVYFWCTDKWGHGLILCALAMFVAGIPQVINFWEKPAPATWWVWAGTAVVCVLSVVSSKKVWSLQNAPALSSLLFQVLVLTILFRPVIFS